MRRARVLRAAPVEPLAISRASDPELAQLVRRQTQQAQAELQAARAHAAQIVRQAQLQAEARAQQVQDELCSRLLDLDRQARSAIARLAQQQRADAMDLAVVLAERLVRRQLEIDAGVLTEMVAEVLRHAEGAAQILLRVHPQDAEKLRARLDELVALVGTDQLTIHEDLGVDRGGCVVETPLLQLDGQVQTQLRALARALRAEIDRSSAEAGGGSQGDS